MIPFTLVFAVIGVCCTVFGILGLLGSADTNNLPALVLNGAVFVIGIFFLLIVICVA